MTVREILNATYAFLTGLVGRDKVDGLLGAPEAQEDGYNHGTASSDAAANQPAISLLSEIGKLPRVTRAR